MLAQRLGIGRIAKYASALGLGQKTGIDLDLRDDPMMRLDEFRFVAQPVGRDVTERYAVA